MVVLLENPADQNALSGDHLVGQVGGAVIEVPRALLGPCKSLEMDFSIQPMGPFYLSGGPFHCCDFL